jgi:hypothetical protein
MKLDARQTRRLLLAGAVPLPKPYPSVGRISIERRKLVYSRFAEKTKTFIVIQEQHKSAVTRLILRSGVAALFFPGIWVRVPRIGRVFKFSRQHAVHNFEKGEWFLGPEINVDAIRTRLRKPKLAIHKRGNPARGIVFVYQDRPVMSVTEVVQLAGCIGPRRTGHYCCDCDGYGCDCCDYGCDCCDYGCDACDYGGHDRERLFSANAGEDISDDIQGCDGEGYDSRCC